MRAKLIKLAPLLLAVAAAGLAGCTKTITVPIQQVRIPARTTVSHVKLESGEMVAFDSTGGRYLPQHRVIAGSDTDGSRQVVKLSRADQVYFTVQRDTAWYSLATTDFKKQEDGRYRDNLKGNITAVNTAVARIELDHMHGRIDSLHRAVTGTSKYGTQVNIPFDDVVSLKVKRTDHLKSWLIIGGVTAVVVGWAIAVGNAVKGAAEFGNAYVGN